MLTHYYYDTNKYIPLLKNHYLRIIICTDQINSTSDLSQNIQEIAVNSKLYNKYREARQSTTDNEKKIERKKEKCIKNLSIKSQFTIVCKSWRPPFQNNSKRKQKKTKLNIHYLFIMFLSNRFIGTMGLTCLQYPRDIRSLF